MTLNYLSLLHALLPEASLVMGALVVLGFDLVVGRRHDLAQRTVYATVLGLLAVLAAVYHTYDARVDGEVFGGVFLLDSLGMATRLGVLVLTALTLALLPGVTKVRQPAEYVAVILFATTGFTLMAVVQQLLVAFVALELASLSLYILAGFDRSRPDSAEAALKYFLLGGISAAFLLFGFSLLYGLTGSIALPEIARQLSVQAMTPLLLVAVLMTVVAFGFKAAAAPFHLWAPDVYQGAPPISAALIASGSKLAGLVMFTRLLWSGVGPAAGNIATFNAVPGWVPAVALVAVLSLLVGNLGALAQSNVRRILAYSAIAHAGVLLLGVITAGKFGPAPLVYYAGTYGLATVGAFGVIAVLDAAGVGGSLADLAGLRQRSPLLAFCLVVFLLSLAGIPPLAGFFGKFAVFAAALKLNGLAGWAGWLSVFAIAMSAVGLYYYLLVLKNAVVVPGRSDAAPIKVPLAAATALLVAAGLILVLGLFPSAVLQAIS